MLNASSPPRIVDAGEVFELVIVMSFYKLVEDYTVSVLSCSKTVTGASNIKGLLYDLPSDTWINKDSISKQFSAMIKDQVRESTTMNHAQ